jgi:hypothetical protein
VTTRLMATQLVASRVVLSSIELGSYAEKVVKLSSKQSGETDKKNYET